MFTLFGLMIERVFAEEILDFLRVRTDGFFRVKNWEAFFAKPRCGLFDSLFLLSAK